MAASPQILFLAHRVPYPPNRGDRIRSFHLLEFLSQRADVSLAYLTEVEPPRETTEVLGALCRQVTCARLGRARWLSAAFSFAPGSTATEGLFRSSSFGRVIARWASETQFDVVVVICSSMVQYLDVPGLVKVPKVIDLIDVDSQKWLDYAAQAQGLKRKVFSLEGNRLRRLECTLPARSRAITLVSQPEVNLFRSFCPADNVHAVPNGVDLAYFRPQPRDSEQSASLRPTGKRTIVFVGALDYRANIDGITWFCRNVWPEVNRQVPDTVLQIVGSHPTSAVRKLAAIAGVQLIGPVDDVRPYLVAAEAAIVPLRVARGVQNKVLEAMAMGRPVIASSRALESIDANVGREILRADTVAEWREQLMEVLHNPEKRDRIGEAARLHVENRPSWQRCLASLEADIGLPIHSVPIAK